MNQLNIIGNLTRDPERREGTRTGKPFVTFTVAVNRPGGGAADFFRVQAWDTLADNCAKYLRKGRKVAVTGPVHVTVYTESPGIPRAHMDVNAQSVEFLTPRPADETELPGAAYKKDEFLEVGENELPF